jgi:hypothetical protein
MKPLYRKTLLRSLPIVFELERTNQLSLLPDKDLVDLCPLLEPYQVTKSPFLSFMIGKEFVIKIQAAASIYGLWTYTLKVMMSHRSYE